MSHVIRKERCPNCSKMGRDRHGDNLAIYSDGGEHCFSCGYHKGGSFKHIITALSDIITDEVIPNPLPYDVTAVIPSKALEWLSTFYITYRDIVHHNILWSESKQYLIFPVNGCWQGRYFGDDPKHPKWKTQGKIHEFPFIQDSPKNIVLVEDILSFIRITNLHYGCCCLFGSESRSSRIYSYLPNKTLVWWLDYDKREEAFKQAVYAKKLGWNTKVVVTEKDPKCYTDEEICGFLL